MFQSSKPLKKEQGENSVHKINRKKRGKLQLAKQKAKEKESAAGSELTIQKRPSKLRADPPGSFVEVVQVESRPLP